MLRSVPLNEKTASAAYGHMEDIKRAIGCVLFDDSTRQHLLIGSVRYGRSCEL